MMTMSRDSLELDHALNAITKVNEAFVLLEGRGYMAQDVVQVMQQMRYAIIALSAWAARQEEDPIGEMVAALDALAQSFSTELFRGTPIHRWALEYLKKQADSAKPVKPSGRL